MTIEAFENQFNFEQTLQKVRDRLNTRDNRIIDLLLNGQNIPKIAKILSKDYSTVRYYLDHIRFVWNRVTREEV